MRRVTIIGCCALLALSGLQAQTASAAGPCNKGSSNNSAASTVSDGSLAGGTATKSVLAKHNLTEFDVDGNGTLDPAERTAARLARKSNRSAPSSQIPPSMILANYANLAQNSLNAQASQAAAAAALFNLTGQSGMGPGGMGGGGMGCNRMGPGMGMGGPMGAGGMGPMGMGGGPMGGGMGMAAMGGPAGMRAGMTSGMGGGGGCMNRR